MTAIEQLRASLPEQYRLDFDWLWRLMNGDRDDAIRFMGFVVAASADLAHFSFWELVACCRKSFKRTSPS